MRFRVVDSSFEGHDDYDTIELPVNIDLSNDEFEEVVNLEINGSIELDNDEDDDDGHKITITRIE